jgi:hypothetical protein
MILTNDRGHAETVLTPGEAGSLQQVRATIAVFPDPLIFLPQLYAGWLHRFTRSLAMASPMRCLYCWPSPARACDGRGQ